MNPSPHIPSHRRASRVPSIGVVLPNRNDSKYLWASLRSVLDQEDKPDELVVIDDQSTDESVALIRELIADHPFARLLINERNLGTFGAVEVALRHARSDYLLFLSANDIVLPGIFAHARRCLGACGGAALWSGLAWLIDEQGQLIRLHPSAVVAWRDVYLPPSQCIELAYRFGNWFTGTTCVYHRETLLASGGFDPAYGAPSDLITALTVASLKGACFSPRPLAAIRVHAGSFSSRALKNFAGVEAMLARIRTLGPTRSSQLFNAAFLERIEERFRFAAVRAAEGTVLRDVAAHTCGTKGAALRFIDAILPSSARTLRVMAAFVALRPYDLLPTLWYRLAGWVIIRLRYKKPRRADLIGDPKHTNQIK